MRNIVTYKERHKEVLMALPNVVGVGVGRKLINGEVHLADEIITVMVERKLPEAALSAKDIIPRSLPTGRYDKYAMSGYVPTDVIEVGEVRALPTVTDKGPTDKWRPAPGGVSIGHFRITAGTFGCVVKDKDTGQRLILSNNHVLADSNKGVVGDYILQPGPYDGGKGGEDEIGILGRFVRINFGEDDSACPIADRFVQLTNFVAKSMGFKHRINAKQINPQATNLVDAAVAIPTRDEDVLDIILDIGLIEGTAGGYIGMNVAKYGRTTLYTEDAIIASNATIRVSYGGGKIATFENQFVAGPMSAGGDSGSLVIERGTQDAVGLLFAGSAQSTIFSPIQFVLDALNVEF